MATNALAGAKPTRKPTNLSQGTILQHQAKKERGATPSSGLPLQTRKWFAVYTRSHHEKAVAACLSGAGVENFLPLYTSKRKWSCNRNPVVSLPLFPNYLFARISPAQRVQLLSTTGVVSLVGNSAGPSPLSDQEVENLKHYLPLGDFQPHPHFIQGTRVQITEGPLAGLEGSVVREKGSVRVVLSISSIALGTSVEVSSCQVEEMS